MHLWLGLDGQSLLKEGCNQLQFHPDLVKHDIAAEACLKYAGWDDKAKAEFRKRQRLSRE